MTHRVDDHYLEPYRDALRRHGAGFSATLWASREAQRTRFDVILDMADFDGARIVDAGCGHGDLAAHLAERDVAHTAYVGLDAFAEQIDEARERSIERAVFEVIDFVHDERAFARHRPDWVCFCGSLNTMREEEARAVIGRAFNEARWGVVFNFLSDRTGFSTREEDLSPARRFDTLAMLDWALRHTPRVSFRQDYLDGHDATIAMRK